MIKKRIKIKNKVKFVYKILLTPMRTLQEVYRFYFEGLPEKFMIKNKKTGFVLDGAELFVAAGPWANKDTQLWTSEASGTSGHYIIRNLGNQ